MRDIPNGTLTNAITTVRALEKSSRRALRVLREMERYQGYDHHGRFVIREGEDVDSVSEELFEFLHLLQEQDPQQELEIVVVSQTGMDKEDEEHD